MVFFSSSHNGQANEIVPLLRRERDAAQAVPAPAASQPTRIDSRLLLRDAREVEIEHVGQIYRLRLTSLGKLILTK